MGQRKMKYHCRPGDHTWDGEGRVKIPVEGYSIATVSAWACPEHDPFKEDVPSTGLTIPELLNQLGREVTLAQAAVEDERERDFTKTVERMLAQVITLNEIVSRW